MPENEKKNVSEDENGIRLDRWFRRRYPDLTHGQLQKLLRTGQVRVDGKRVDASQRLESGQSVRIPPQVEKDKDKDKNKKRGVAKETRNAEKLLGMVLYKDDDVVVLNKPAGLAVQGGTGLKENVDDSLMALSLDGKTKPKLVHRLDRDTSGVLLIARNDFAAAKLAESFRGRETTKIYWAVTVGVPNPQNGKIDVPLVKRGETMVVASKKTEDAKSAVTLYNVQESAKDLASFVALVPVTGRTHQLRVHMSHIGTPILGDRLYGKVNNEKLPMDELGSGLHLHARRLIIPHPRRGVIDVTAPLGREMKKTWRWFQFEEKDDIEVF